LAGTSANIESWESPGILRNPQESCRNHRGTVKTSPSWLLRHHTLYKTHMFRVWKVGPWSPALSSCTESLIRSPLTSQTHGLNNSNTIAFLTSTLACTIVSPMASILASLAYLKHTLLLITLPFINIQKPTTRLWRMNSGKEHGAFLTG
jgi:hypothetical protein